MDEEAVDREDEVLADNELAQRAAKIQKSVTDARSLSAHQVQYLFEFGSKSLLRHCALYVNVRLMRLSPPKIVCQEHSECVHPSNGLRARKYGRAEVPFPMSLV